MMAVDLFDFCVCGTSLASERIVRLRNIRRKITARYTENRSEIQDPNKRPADEVKDSRKPQILMPAAVLYNQTLRFHKRILAPNRSRPLLKQEHETVLQWVAQIRAREMWFILLRFAICCECRAAVQRVCCSEREHPWMHGEWRFVFDRCHSV
jgi:hypothetical protein